MAGLMQTFPPRPDEQVTLANWRTYPFNVWAFHHVREIVPSADIANDPDAVWHLPCAPVDLVHSPQSSETPIFATEPIIPQMASDENLRRNR
ncbi:MAG: hypothetical protein ETSY1_47125 (plasmid) [Candidatus Entotheonella factor]|uniref:Uncharacterized protein n=1 Tax=Entotheonella factor TaxID=1429438 RepID=W4LZY6_ENTF1|nr:MAG: hypothetical protein ETSY1_47125 [Candidatus Entotheonella factor]